MRNANISALATFIRMAKSLCLMIFSLVIMMFPANVEGQDINIEEHPSSLLLAVNEIGNFSCRANCSVRCFGQWIINNETVLRDTDRSEWNRMGFIFPESNTESQDIEHVLMLSVNASKRNNNSVIQCQYMSRPSGNFESHHGIGSRTASVLVIPNDIELSSSAISTSVLFEGNGTPVLMEVYFQLPGSLCGLQQILSFIHYYLSVEDTQGSLEMHNGPFSNLSSCIIKRLIEPDLKENESYTLTAIVGTQSRNITSSKHSFNTSFIGNAPKTCTIQNGTDSLFSYQLIIIVSLGLAVLVLLSVLITVLLCICVTHKRRIREKKVMITKNKLCKSMVHNPLYDRSGPEYEIVPPRLETSTPFAQPAMDEISATHSAANQHYDTISTPGLSSRQDTPTADTSHYVDQPLHSSPKFRSASLSSNAHLHSPYNMMSRSTTSSVPTTSLMGLKRNGQERNKLHLTLSLGDRSDPTVVTTSATGNDHKVMASDTNDNSTVMNPITSRQNIGCKSLRITRQENSVLYSV